MCFMSCSLITLPYSSCAHLLLAIVLLLALVSDTCQAVCENTLAVQLQPISPFQEPLHLPLEARMAILSLLPR